MVTDGKETCAGARLAGYTSIKSLLCAPEANALYVNYTSVKGKKNPHMAEEPWKRPGGCKPPPLKRQPPRAEFKEEGSSVPSELREAGHNHSEAPSGAHQKRTESLTRHSIRLCLQRLQKQQRGCTANTTPQGCSELKDSGQTPKFWFVFLKEMEEGLGFDQPAPYALWGILFFLPKYVGQSVSLCIFPLSFVLVEDFMKLDREETKAFV